MHRATKRADHSSSDARLETERIPNRDHELAYAQTLGVGEAHMRQLRRIDANHGKIRVRIVARHLRRIFAPIGQANGDGVRRMNDMTISQNESVRRDDKTRAVTAELTRSALDVDALFDVDVHNRWRNTGDGTNDGTRICIEQEGIVLACYGCVEVPARL